MVAERGFVRRTTNEEGGEDPRRDEVGGRDWPTADSISRSQPTRETRFLEAK